MIETDVAKKVGSWAQQLLNKMAFWYYLVYNNTPTPRPGLKLYIVFVDVNIVFFEMNHPCFEEK